MPYRAQVELPYRSGLAEDVSVNVFHFSDLAATELELQNASEALTTFYSDIEAYLSGIFSGTIRLKWYDMDDPMPRDPILSGEFVDGFSGTTPTLPEEVAIAISTHAAGVSGTPRARRRGRFYIGPLSSAAVNFDTLNGTSVGEVIRTFLGGAVVDLHEALVSAGMTPAVYSRTDGVFRAIESYSLDDAVDTIRSRGRRPSVRQPFTPA